MRIARLPNGQFAPGNRGGPGRPPVGEMTKAELKRQREIIAAWRAGGEGLIAQMTATLDGPTCRHCGKPMALSPWRARRAFCSAACANGDVKRRRTGARRRNARSKLSRGLKAGPSELAALDGEAS